MLNYKLQDKTKSIPRKTNWKENSNTSNWVWHCRV